jgi:hypothetical protein
MVWTLVVVSLIFEVNEYCSFTIMTGAPSHCARSFGKIFHVSNQRVFSVMTGTGAN